MRRPELPPTMGEKADPNTLFNFMRWYFRPDTAHRTRLVRMLNRARNYRQSNQWLEPLYGLVDVEGEALDWKPLQQGLNDIPLPVMNFLFSRITRETALLVGVGSKAYVLADANDANAVDGARVAKQSLENWQKEIGWQDTQREGGMHICNYGTSGLMARWDVDFTVTTKIPVTTAVRCPNPKCGFSLASPEMPPLGTGDRPTPAMFATLKLVGGAPNAFTTEPPTESTNQLRPPIVKHTAVACPTCPDAQRLIPFMEPDPKTKDAIGRPLGESVALGDVAAHLISPYDLYLQDQGIDVNPQNWREVGVAMPMSLDWFRSHFANGWQVKPDASEWLWRYHPLIRELGIGAEGAGPEIFQHSALWQTYVAKPTTLEPTDGNLPEANGGRVVMMGGRTLLCDSDLMIEGPDGRPFPSVYVDWCPWELRDRSGYGLGMVEMGSGQQDTINTGKSQVMDARHRLSNPKLLAKRGTQFDYQGGVQTGYPTDILTWEGANPDDPGVPIEIGGKLFPSGYWEEFQKDLEALDDVLMVREVESGFPPKSVDAYSALVLLLKQAAKGREPRIERMRDFKSRFYKAVLQLMQWGYIEERQYRVDLPNERYSIEKFKGLDFRGQTDLKLIDEPIVDPGLTRRTGISEGIKLGTIRLDTETAKRKVNEALEIPPDINEERNHQVEMAERECHEWRIDNIEPVIDEDGDDHMIHWEIQKLELGRRDWMELKKACHWRKVVKAMWGWKEHYDGILALEAEVKALQAEGGPIKPDPVLQEGNPEAYAQAVRLYTEQMQKKAVIDELPKLPELRIVRVWAKMLKDAGGIPELRQGDQEGLMALGKVMRLEAHAAAHRFVAEQKALAAAAGSAAPAAPGGVQTEAGTIPAPGEPAAAPGEGAAPMGA